MPVCQYPDIASPLLCEAKVAPASDISPHPSVGTPYQDMHLQTSYLKKKKNEVA